MSQVKWFCYSCNENEPCIFVLPKAIEEKPQGCLLNIDGVKWQKEMTELQYKVKYLEDNYSKLDLGNILRFGKLTHDYIVESRKVIKLFKEKYPEDFE